MLSLSCLEPRRSPGSNDAVGRGDLETEGQREGGREAGEGREIVWEMEGAGGLCPPHLAPAACGPPSVLPAQQGNRMRSRVQRSPRRVARRQSLVIIIYFFYTKCISLPRSLDTSLLN